MCNHSKAVLKINVLIYRSERNKNQKYSTISKRLFFPVSRNSKYLLLISAQGASRVVLQLNLCDLRTVAHAHPCNAYACDLSVYHLWPLELLLSNFIRDPILDKYWKSYLVSLLIFLQLVFLLDLCWLMGNKTNMY